MTVYEMPARAFVAAHVAVRSRAYSTMIEFEASGGAFRLKRIASRPHAGPVYTMEPKGNLVVAEALGGEGVIILHEAEPDAERALKDRRALARRSHPQGTQIAGLITAGQRIALRSRHSSFQAWTRSQKLGVGAALGLAFLLFDYLHSTGRLSTEGLRLSLLSVELVFDVESTSRAKRSKQMA